ncbi:putative bifunctional diguanylate cyclase/phosphodiesterase [Chitinimonas taiwanensis]|uniref:putative bifunctional diguanylate cyclase/phosphodiesterase n=1 Tax=Chitinimonas taiwanensis TaxID=240412 RepID=UPI0035B12745
MAYLVLLILAMLLGGLLAALWLRRRPAPEVEGRQRSLLAQQLALMDSIDDLAWLKDTESRFVLVNRKFASVFNCTPDSLIGKTDRDLSPPEMAEHFLAEDREVMQSGQPKRVVEKIHREEGGFGWAETIKVPVFDETGSLIGTAGVARDITARKAAEEQISQQARHDPLTGLPNRLYLAERFEQYRAEHAQFAVLFLDLDNFKLINDTDGHTVGDALLQQIALRLRGEVEDSGFVCRHGGDEFLILYPSPHPLEVESFAQRVARALVRPYLIAGNEYVISASIGMASFPAQGEDRLTLIKHADIAMYEAKRQGRNRFTWFAAPLAEQAAHKRKVEMQLRAALEHESLSLHFQPLIDLASGRIIGAEALVRMRAADGSLVSPASFIPLAEETGLILPLGDWILSAALRQLAQWRRAGWDDFVLAVNISGIQFRQSQFVPRLAEMLEVCAVPGRFLELELTEGVLAEQSVDAIAGLQQLKALGVRLAIDDFGTGYSSLSYLKRLPIDRLKIDRSFVDDLPGHAGDVAITRSIVHIARAFDLAVTAEGVENQAQRDFLRELGCQSAQGYWFSKPVPAEALEVLLREGHGRPA